MSFLDDLLGLFRRVLGADESYESLDTSMELAYAVVLYELAFTDYHFDEKESHYIRSIFRKGIGLTDSQTDALLEETSNVLKEYPDIDAFAMHLSQNLTEIERKGVLDTLDTLMEVDGTVDELELRLRERFQTILGVTWH